MARMREKVTVEQVRWLNHRLHVIDIVVQECAECASGNVKVAFQLLREDDKLIDVERDTAARLLYFYVDSDQQLNRASAFLDYHEELAKTAKGKCDGKN